MSKPEISHVEALQTPHHKASLDADVSTRDIDADDEERRRLTKSLLWKLDTRMLPMLGALFLFSFLDRTNIGAAKTLGLETDLNLTGNQYSNCLAIFFAFYIAAEVPSNLVLKRVSPRIWLGILTTIWGVIGMCMGFVQSYSGLLVVRAFLGAAEGGLLPGIVLFLSMMYKREDIGIRLGIIYSSASLSGAFGGLLATGLYQIGGRGGLAGWRWILIIEGIMTALIGILAIFILPSTVDKAPFLTPAEREHAITRLYEGRPLTRNDQGEYIIAHDPFSWSAVIRAVISPRTWLSAIAYLAILTALYTFGLFIPTLIVGLGYSAVRAQLFSVPPYAVAAVLTIIAAFISDRKKTRGPVMLCFLPLAIAGYATIAFTTDTRVKYGALFLMASGLYPAVPPVLVWLSNNFTQHYTRATAIGLQLSIANCGGLVGTYVYAPAQAPVYKQAHTIVMGLLCGAWVLIAIKVAYLMYENRQKQAGNRERWRGCGDERDPEFRYII